MGRAQVLFNQRHGRGWGRGTGPNPGRVNTSDARKRTSRPKWNAGKNDEEHEEKHADANYELEERLEEEVSLLESNVYSQRYVITSKNDDPETVTLALNLFQSDSGKFNQHMNYALKHLSLEDRFRIPSRLVSSITGEEPDNDIQDESTVVSSLSSVTAKFRVANVLADPVASRLGIHNLPSKPVNFSGDQERSPPKSGRVSLLGVTTSASMDAANHLSKRPTIPASQESKEIVTPNKSFHIIESSGSSQDNQEEEDPAADLIMRLRSLPSQDQNEIPPVATASSNEEDIDEWLKETLNNDDTSSNIMVESKDKEGETLDEEHLEDWLDTMI